MARLWSSGAELQSSAAGVEITNVSGTGVAIDTSNQRSGAACYSVTKSSGTPRGFNYQFASANGNGPYYFRIYLKVSAWPSARSTIISLAGSATFNSTPVIEVDMNTDGTLFIHDNTSSGDGTASAALSTGTWYRLEIKFDRTPAAGSQIFEAKIDGTAFRTYTTGNFTAGGIQAVNVGWEIDGTNAGSGQILYFDDIAINDTTGSAQTTYPGAGSIVHMQPDGTGDNAAWSTGAGGTNNWDRVDEVTPDDATTYNQSTTAGTHLDDHTVESSSNAGIGSSDTITLVAVGLRGGANGATGTRQASPRIKSQSSGTTTTGTTLSFAVNGWATNGITAPKNHPLVSYTDPQAGGSWTPSLLDSMQIGYDDGASSTSARRITTCWALVEYVPAAGGGATEQPELLLMGVGS